VSGALGADQSSDPFGKTRGDRKPHALIAPCRLEGQLTAEPMITQQRSNRSGTSDRISDGMFVVSGAFVDSVRSRGPVTLSAELGARSQMRAQRAARQIDTVRDGRGLMQKI
jgi:hypothetical protein